MKTILFMMAVVGTTMACHFPPHLWCSSKEIAVECEVYEQCKKFLTEQLTAPPVSLELYYESLCPDCQNFINKQLHPTYLKVASILNITLIPYGNAREEQVGGKWKFTCQHGENECIGNILETCAIHVLQTMDKIMPLIYCMESSRRLPSSSVKECAKQLAVPLDPILSCANSSLGNQLEHQMALRTEALKPSHTYVPWIVLNGVHTEKINDEATSDLLKLVCKTYSGPKPSACSSTESKPSVCYRTDWN